MTRTKAAAWAGGALYLLMVGLLVGAATRASGTVHAVGSLLAVSLLAGVVRRKPQLALAMALFGSTAVVAGTADSLHDGLAPSYQGQFLSFLAADLVLGFVVATRTRRASIVAVAASTAVQLPVIGLFAHGDSMTVNAVIAPLAMAAACMAGLLSRERREHAVALRSQEVDKAVTAERLRIARELHDMVAHSIGIIAIQAGVGSRVIQTQPEQARETLRAIEATSRETLSGLRRTLVSLRQADRGATASEQSPLAPSPGLADVEQLAAATADAGVRVDVRRSGGERPLPADIDLSAYRIVQEALTNVVRHAGTGHCRVDIDYGDEELSVEVVDDGRGVTGNGSAHGFGIVGMRERAGLLHGRLSAGPRPEGGFRVAARLPLPGPVGVPVEAR
ncbi:sensor histidine kinase (plasmid) [Streptomyces goshikiensis]|uniref:sensor histidine kinase n=1 Tax=Streptomyces goshikiensis TaxID=1942 RepID=UPI0022F3CA6B|nr:sensor histidine kinase [Streptomyces goshikiensis]WBY24586.1 sensor histidine kinase [Streptomyces goshikiensis]WSS03643.1 sensor histidine kinase [Streptomyces goshikiensis]WSY02754.1 sensor histidine kinase [Streptomyces goshikiensis]